MKKYFILTALLFASFGTASAQQIDGRITIDNVKIERTGDNLQVEYRVTVPRGTVRRGYTMLLTPFVTADSAEYSQSLPAVAVQGRGARIASERGEWVGGLTENSENITYLRNGQTTTLTATVPFQEWMYGSRLGFSVAEGGCCSYRVLNDMFLETGLEAPAPVVVETVPEPAGWVPVTLADSLSTAFTFVLPASEYDAAEPFKIYDDERENALVVYYHLGKHNIVPDYLDNEHTLSSLVNVIRMIMEADDSRVERVVIAGFASPEGGFELNNRLAFERAVTIKRYIMDRAGVADSRIELFNGAEDWRGLRAMVAKSNLPEKQQVLDIIDNTPVWDSRRNTGRQAELMRLNGGRTYRYLLNEYFPYLRSGAFIRVYYENE